MINLWKYIVELQFISGVSAVNLVAFYDIEKRESEILFYPGNHTRRIILGARCPRG
jgi:hypothetical protein